MILHIFPDEKFTKPYIKFINNNFDINEHIFFILSSGNFINKNEKIEKNVIINEGMKSLPFLVSKMNKCKKIIIHSMFNKRIVFILFSQPWILKKCNWVIWGGDLYCYREATKSVKSKMFRKIRNLTIKRFGEVTTLVKEDYYLAKKHYNIKGKYNEGMYPNTINLEYLNSIKKNKKNKEITCINIQIGNSADKSNQHIEAINMLKKYKDENINIYVPLSYGDKEYAKKVKEYGEEIFGHKFKAILSYMSPQKYSEFLGSIDIGIFNNNRQQALGNIFILSYLGSKIYIRNDTTMWKELCECRGYKIKNLNFIEKEDFDEFIKYDKNEMKINEKLSQNRFDEDYMANVWKKVF